MEKEFIKNAGIIATIFLFFTLSIMTLRPEVTGFFVLEGVSVNQVGVSMITIAVILIIFIIVNKGKAREIAKNVIGALVIYLGIYTMTKIAPSLDLVIGAISLTFGLMALIWVWKAKIAFSKGSSMRDFSGSFFSCLLSILMYSILESFIIMRNLGGVWIYLKYALMTIAYINFVYAAYKMRSLGTTFGFEDQGKRIKKVLNPRK